MANQHPMRAEQRDAERYGAETVAAREAMRTAQRDEAQNGHVRQRHGASISVGLIAVLIAILSVIAVWLKT